MMRIGCLGFGMLLVVGCSDDGHVVGEMQAEGAGGTTTITATSGGGTANGDTAGSDGDASTAAASGTGASSGGAGAAGGAGGTTSATAQSTSAGGSGAASSNGGSAGADTSSGGTSGAAGETATSTTSPSTTSTTGSDPCPPGEIWCPGCSPGEGICSAGGCPGVACPSCSEITTLEECEVTYGCHAVFNDPETCGCLAIGCCARFAFCAPGSTANCEGPVTCASAAPYCSEPMYVPSYINDCIEGCVRPEVCAD